MNNLGLGGNQKRVGEERTKNNWVLDIDADELVTDELANEIRMHFKNGEPDCKRIFNTNNYCAHGKPWYNFSRAYR